MKRIDQYESVKPLVDGIHLKEFRNYEVGKLLYASLWGMFGLSAWQRMKRVLAILICKTLWLSDYLDTAEGMNLAFEIHFLNERPRKDNEAIYQNIYEYMKPAKHLLLEKRYSVSFSGVLKRTIRLIKYSGSMRSFSLTERLYLSAQLVLSKGLIELLETRKVFENIKYMLIFQEYDTISSTVIQCAHHHAVKAISPQHSMPMNRHENIDQLFFDGFLCDYKLVWNEFEKEQYISAGIDPNRVFVVGNTKDLGLQQQLIRETEVDDKKWSKFGVLLDYPGIDGAIEANNNLLITAKTLIDHERLSCIVKLHPTDNAERYKNVLDSKDFEVLLSSAGMDEYQGKVAFSLAHITGAIFDQIYRGCYVFQYIFGEAFPVDMNEIYKFSSTEELIQNYRIWRKDFSAYQIDYKRTIAKYRVDDARKRHDVFFRKLFAGELEKI